MFRSQIRIKDCGFIQDSQVVGAAAHGKPESISEFENYINSEFRQGPSPTNCGTRAGYSRYIGCDCAADFRTQSISTVTQVGASRPSLFGRLFTLNCLPAVA